MNMLEIRVPDIGDFKEVEVIEVLVKPGDVIKAEQSLVTVESDKASMEIPSSSAGVVREVQVKLGDKIAEGSVMLTLDVAGSGVGQAAEPEAKPQAVAAQAAPQAGPQEVGQAPAEAPSADGAPTGPIEIHVPDIGDFAEVEVIELLAKPGDTIEPEQSLITVESDKASMEIPSSAGGILKELKVKVGDKVAKGTLLAVIEGKQGGASAPAAAATATASAAAAPTAQTQAAPVTAPAAAESAPSSAPAFESRAIPNDSSGATLPHASPSVRKFARELGVDLNRVTGTGPNQRILHEDVQGYVKGAVAAVVSGGASAAAPSTGGASGGLQLIPWPSLDFSKFGATETLALSRIKRLSGPNLARNWAMIPHVTQFDEADITELEQFRKDSNEALAKSGTKLTMLAFVIKASVAALKKFPNFNASLDATGENLILKQYWNIGFAADTPNGLVVPVVKGADQKGMSQIAKELGELSALARDGKLKLPDMQGATFTISSLGGVGGTAFTPIINAPEVAILGLSKSQTKPVWDGKQFVPRLMLPLSLSFDHRVIDGAQAARFAAYLGEVLADMRKILL